MKLYIQPIFYAALLAFISTVVAIPDYEQLVQNSHPPYNASRPAPIDPASNPPPPPAEPVPPGTPSLREEDVVPKLRAETMLQAEGNLTMTGTLKAYSKNVKFCEGEIKPYGKSTGVQCQPGYSLHYNWTGAEGTTSNKTNNPKTLGYTLSHWDLTPNGTKNDKTWMRVKEGWLCAECHSKEGEDFKKCTLLGRNCGNSETAVQN